MVAVTTRNSKREVLKDRQQRYILSLRYGRFINKRSNMWLGSNLPNCLSFQQKLKKYHSNSLYYKRRKRRNYHRNSGKAYFNTPSGLWPRTRTVTKQKEEMHLVLRASLTKSVASLLPWLCGTGFESRLGRPFISYHLILVCVNYDLNGSLHINSRLHARLNNQISHPILQHLEYFCWITKWRKPSRMIPQMKIKDYYSDQTFNSERC